MTIDERERLLQARLRQQATVDRVTRKREPSGRERASAALAAQAIAAIDRLLAQPKNK